ncbi:hypothetical protein [Limnohabitans sp. T6-5]|uniref:hypothetical protein n=1 Tax=Limnohabitans sp. T6-5 TaxID=1100724 RepID=UPI0011B29EB0|nr:hypothetical protein [Limnohabitans sp. T6-5]
MNHKKIIFPAFIAISFFLSGCVSRSIQMINDNGHAANCEASGIGIIGAPAAYAMTEECINKYKQAGYREADAPKISQTTATSTQSTPIAPLSFSSKDQTFKITLDSGWMPLLVPNQSPQLSLKNPTADTYLIINTNNISDISDWGAYSENTKTRLTGNLTNSTFSDFEKIKVNGFDALQGEIGGTLKNGLKVRYVLTTLKTNEKIIQILTWTTESRFNQVKRDLQNIPNNLSF